MTERSDFHNSSFAIRHSKIIRKSSFRPAGPKGPEASIKPDVCVSKNYQENSSGKQCPHNLDGNNFKGTAGKLQLGAKDGKRTQENQVFRQHAGGNNKGNNKHALADLKQLRDSLYAAKQPEIAG